MRKFRCIKTVLVNAPMSLVMAVAAQVINLMLGHISKLDIAQMLLSFVVSFPLAFVIGYFLPLDELGMGLAKKCGAQMGTLKFDALTDLVVNTGFCVLMTLYMTWFFLCVLGHAPIQALPAGFMEMIVPVWLCCYVVSLIILRPSIRLAKRLSGMSEKKAI